MKISDVKFTYKQQTGNEYLIYANGELWGWVNSEKRAKDFCKSLGQKKHYIYIKTR